MNKNNKQKNRGSVSVFMLCLLIPMIIFICVMIAIAQMMAADGYAADAMNLAENSVYSSYNKAFFDSYGIMCYTKSTSTLTGIANESAHASTNAKETYGGVSFVKVDVDMDVEYQTSTCLNNNTVLINEINAYMSDYVCIASSVGSNTWSALSSKMYQADSIKQQMQNHLNAATNQQPNNDDPGETTEPSPEEVTASQDATDFRKDKIGITDIRNIGLDAGNSCFSTYGNGINSVADVISYNYDSEDNVETAIDMLDAAVNYYKPISDMWEYKGYATPTYRLALYCYNNFSAYNNFAGVALTGRYFGSGNNKSVSEWGETEYIINGASNENDNWDAVKARIYNTYFTEYMADTYYTIINDADVINSAQVLSGGDSVKCAIIKDEIAVGICAKLAYKATDQAYTSNGKPVNSDRLLNYYTDYMEVFLVMETTRNKDQVMERMKKVMQLNMANSSYRDSNEFSFNSAYLIPVVEGSYTSYTSF